MTFGLGFSLSMMIAHPPSPGPPTRRGSMDDPELLALYEWAPGDCFRCAQTGVDTASVKQIDTPAGVRYDARACRGCVLAIEGERKRHAEETGQEYVPGHVGEVSKK
jgi:hypothetical protein